MADGKAVLLDIKGALGVATAEYVVKGIEDAQAQGAKLIILRMDTPGGLMEPMRDIVQAILASSVPVATWVSPGGARADSAGTFILLASHIAAMAPTTHLGAATPVQLIGDDGSDDSKPGNPFAPPAPEEKDTEATDEKDPGDAEDEKQPEVAPPGSAMDRKVMNDAISYIRGLAEAHGRNADWAETAVTEAATLTATEALELNVIDLIAASQADLLEAVNGRVVKVNNADYTVDAEALVIEVIEPGWRLKVLGTIAKPEIAILLLMVGMYGLLFEGYNPGAIIPGVVGVICLLLAAYALQVLPVNYAGLALILVGIALITAEAFVPSFGALGIGGLAAIIFGSIMMFDSGIPGFGISVTFVIGLALVAGLLLLWLVSYLVKARRQGAVSGRDRIVGGHGVAMESFTGEGKVWLEGEAWSAKSKSPVEKDQKVLVLDLVGLTLEVEPVSETDETSAQLQT
ncbi:MAG: nodulation protein NfeD [Woeseiaceae bacterium]|nr:nodulation protein NfeD [Woeseiaceae bacterium]